MGGDVFITEETKGTRDKAVDRRRNNVQAGFIEFSGWSCLGNSDELGARTGEGRLQELNVCSVVVAREATSGDINAFDHVEHGDDGHGSITKWGQQIEQTNIRPTMTSLSSMGKLIVWPVVTGLLGGSARDLSI